MACDVTALILYSVDALAEDEVVRLANHVTWCASCRNRLTNRAEFRAAVLACVTPPNARPDVRPKDRRQTRTKSVAA